AMRLDLLSLPLLAAAAVVLLFGLRALISFVYPLLFLTLCWPLPYEALLEQVLSTSTPATGAAVSVVLAVLPGAPSSPTTGDPRYLLDWPGVSFIVSVASSCAGLSSVLGSLIVGLALLYVVRGRMLRRLAWLVFGLALVWLLNVV